jgi:aminoglycoside/choline kinase family phosphotransferase
MQAALDQSGIRVPAVYAHDDARGLALIEDLGDRDFGTLMRNGTLQDYLYSIALDALLTLHKAPPPKNLQLKQFTPQVFLEQVGLFFDGYSAAVLKRGFGANAKTEFENAWHPALEKACTVPNAIMLRDYHAANIMFLEHEVKHKKAAMIDFQDGGIGPITYDLASLLEDARLDILPALRAYMLEIYVGTSGISDPAAFTSSYHILACQRHMRILAILAKRWVSGGFPETEDYFKRVWGLLMLHKSEPLLKPVYDWLNAYVPRDYRQLWKPAS